MRIVNSLVLGGACLGFIRSAVAEPPKPTPDIVALTTQAEAGDADAMLRLGEAFADGNGINRDEASAIHWLERAGESGNVRAMTRVGTILDDGSLERAMKMNPERPNPVPDRRRAAGWWRKAAETGDAEASFRLSLLVIMEGGDREESLRWTQKAADLGHPAAMADLARAYRSGTKSVPQDDALATHWLIKAAEAGDRSSISEVGSLYLEGTGVPPNVPEAISWFERAADGGDSGAFIALGKIYQTGRGVPKDEKRAADYYIRAGRAGPSRGYGGDPSFLHELFKMFSEGRGVEKNTMLALGWYMREKTTRIGVCGVGRETDPAKILASLRARATSDKSDDLLALAHALEAGSLHVQDLPEAARLYRVVAERGMTAILDDGLTPELLARELAPTKAMYALGNMLVEGRGVARDDKMAFAWFQRGADRGNYLAMNALGNMYRDGRGTAPNMPKAIEWWRTSAMFGESDPMVSLGAAYAKGAGVSKDEKAAAEWYEKARRRGNP